MSNPKILIGLKLLLFAVLLLVGFTLAAYKPLWNDEVYTQVASVSRSSYGQIISGHVGEGNVSPLFYLLQKSFQNIIHYSAPADWHTGWSDNGLKERLLLRVMPVVFMSAAIAGIFYFFSRNYSLWTGILALFLALSTSMTWGYWAEARPYALWVYLTAMQSIVFLRIFQKDGGKNNAWAFLSVLHILLALTVVFALPQILLVSLILGFSFRRKWSDYVLLTVIPAAVCLYYYALTPKYPFWLEFNFEQYVRAGISRDRLYILALFALLLLGQGLIQNRKWGRDWIKPAAKEAITYFIFTLGMIASVGVTVLLFKLLESPRGTGFPVSDRYFIHLAPVGIIATTLLARESVSVLRHNRWLKIVFVIAAAYFFLARFLRVLPEIAGYYPLLFK